MIEILGLAGIIGFSVILIHCAMFNPQKLEGMIVNLVLIGGNMQLV